MVGLGIHVRAHYGSVRLQRFLDVQDDRQFFHLEIYQSQCPVDYRFAFAYDHSSHHPLIPVVCVGDEWLAYKLRPLDLWVIISEHCPYALKSLGLAGIQSFDLSVRM